MAGTSYNYARRIDGSASQNKTDELFFENSVSFEAKNRLDKNVWLQKTVNNPTKSRI